MKVSGGSTQPNRVVLELATGAKIRLVENSDGTLSINESTYRLINVQPDARNAVTLVFPMPAGIEEEL